MIVRADNKIMRYTFFVPRDSAFFNMLPQDTADPFVIDSDFRHQVLLNHFVRQRLYAKDLVDGFSFTTANNQTVTVSQKDGVTRVNDAEILESDVFIYNLGTVFVIDQPLFVSSDMIYQVLEKHASELTPFGSFGGSDGSGVPSSPDDKVEHQTVVVDLLAEFMASEAETGTTDSAAHDAVVFP